MGISGQSESCPLREQVATRLENFLVKLRDLQGREMAMEVGEWEIVFLGGLREWDGVRERRHFEVAAINDEIEARKVCEREIERGSKTVAELLLHLYL